MLKVLFLPYCTENAYQDVLIDGLRSLGIQVEFWLSRDEFPILDAIDIHGKPDILHLHWTNFLLPTHDRKTAIRKFQYLLTQLYIAKSLDIKIVWTVHELVQHESECPELERVFHQHLLTWYDAILVHGQAARDAVIQTYQIPERDHHKIHLTALPNYVARYDNTLSREEARQTLELSSVKTSFLFFGQIRPYKGVLELIASFSQLEDANIELLIVGKPFREFFRKQIEQAGRHDRRIKLFLQYVPEQEVQYYLNSADVVVLPFQQFLTSSTLLLAMSFGKAIIAPPHGNILDVLDEKGGIFCDPSNQVSLSQALNTALTADLQRMGAYNRKKVETFDRHRIAQQTAALYHRLYRSVTEKGKPDFNELFTYFPDEVTPHILLSCMACVIDSQVKHGKELVNFRSFCSSLRPIFPSTDQQLYTLEHVFEWWSLKGNHGEQGYRKLVALWTDCYAFVRGTPSSISLHTVCDWKEDIWPSYIEEENRAEAMRILERYPDISPQNLLPLLQFLIAKSSFLITPVQIRNFCREWNTAHPGAKIPHYDVLAVYLTIFGQALIKHKQWHIGMEALKKAVTLSWHPHALRAWTDFLAHALEYVVEGIRKI